MKLSGSTIKNTLIATLAFGLLTIMSCKEIGGIARERPPIPDGVRYIEILVSTTDGSAMPSYVATVTTPDGSTQNPVTSSEPVFIVEDLVNGTYSIAFTSDTHIGRVVEVEVTLPANAGDDYSSGNEIFLTKKNAPVVIDNQAGGTINVPPMGNGQGGLGSQSVTVTIPPGALAGTGSTSISVTPSPSTQDASSNSTTLSGVEFTFEPSGLVFEEPITVQLPLDFPPSVARVPTNFVYKSTGESVPVTMSADGKTGTAEIDHFSVWTIVLDARVVVVNTGQNANISFTGGCSEALNEPFTYARTYGPIISNILQKPANNRTVTVNGSFTKSAMSSYRLTGKASVNAFSYTLRTSAGDFLEGVNKIPLCSACRQITYSSAPCHAVD